MKSKINYLISLLLGLLIIMSVAGIPVEVFNHPKTFAVFGMAGISLIISFLCNFWNTFVSSLYKGPWENYPILR